jgi:REP element-mobilizing transposase RayT
MAEVYSMSFATADDIRSLERISSRETSRPNELLVSRRLLPHWELGGSTYFVTYRCADGVVLRDVDQSIVIENWRNWHGQRYLLHAAVAMPDHVHVLITPLACERGWVRLSKIMQTNKGFSSREINKCRGRTGSVWHEERFDRIVRNDAEFSQKWNYIAENPARAELVGSGEPYPGLYLDPDAWPDETSK